MILGVASLVFFFGGELYARSEISIKDLYTVFECAIIGEWLQSSVRLRRVRMHGSVPEA